MFRKLILSGVLAVGALTGVAAATAEARPPVEYRHRFEVVVGRGHHWVNRGSFHNRFEAERFAERLRHEGFRAQVREF